MVKLKFKGKVEKLFQLMYQNSFFLPPDLILQKKSLCTAIDRQSLKDLRLNIRQICDII